MNKSTISSISTIKKEAEKLVQATINLQSKQIKYHISTNPPLSSLTFDVRCPQNDQPILKAEVQKNIKCFSLRKPQKFKPHELTTVEARVGLYETELMKFEKNLFKNSEAKGKKETFKIRLEITRELGEVLKIIQEEKKVGEFIFGFWWNEMELRIRQANTYAELNITVNASSDHELDVLRCQFEAMIKKVICISHTFSTSNICKHYCNRYKPGENWLIIKQTSQKVFILTKQVGLSRDMFHYAFSLTEKTINLRLIFKQPNVISLFVSNELEELQKQPVGVQFFEDKKELKAIGELSELLQFETTLHQLYLSYKVTEFEWENNPRVIAVLNKVQQIFQKQNLDQKTSNTERSYLFYQKCQKSKEFINKVIVKIICKNSSKLQNEYARLINKLISIKKQLIIVDPQLTTVFTRTVKDPTVNEQKRLEYQHQVSIEYEDQVIVVIGQPKNIEEFKKQLESISLNLNTKIPVGDIVKKQPKQISKVIEQNVTVMLSSKQILDLSKEQFYQNGSLKLLRQVSQGFYEYLLTGKDLDEMIGIKINFQNFIARTKNTKEVQLPHQWNHNTINIVVKISLFSCLSIQKNYLAERLKLPSEILIEDLYRIEDKEYYYKFYRANIANTKAKEVCLYYRSPYPTPELIRIINEKRIKQLSTLNEKSKLSWILLTEFKVNMKNRETIIIIRSKLDKQTKQKTIQLTREQDFYPQYIVTINPNLDPDCWIDQNTIQSR